MQTFRPNYLVQFTLLGFLITLFVLIPTFLYTVVSLDKFVTFNSTLEASIFLLIIFLLFVLLYIILNYLLVLTKSISFSANQLIITFGVFGTKKDKLNASEIKSLKLIKMLKTVQDLTETKYKAEEMQKNINKQLQQGKFIWAESGVADLKRYMLIETKEGEKLYYMTGWSDKVFYNLQKEAEKVLGSKVEFTDFTSRQIKKSW